MRSSVSRSCGRSRRRSRRVDKPPQAHAQHTRDRTHTHTSHKTNNKNTQTKTANAKNNTSQTANDTQHNPPTIDDKQRSSGETSSWQLIRTSKVGELPPVVWPGQASLEVLRWPTIARDIVFVFVASAHCSCVAAMSSVAATQSVRGATQGPPLLAPLLSQPRARGHGCGFRVARDVWPLQPHMLHMIFM